MRLKSFQAKSMPEAMRQVRDALGDDAIIVSSKEEASGWVRITAAVEQLNPDPETARESLKKEQRGFDEETIAEMVTETMLRHRVPSGISDKIISAAMTFSDGDPLRTLAKALKKTLTFAELEAEKSKPVVLVGPPGAGKTLMAAKLAAHAVLNRQKAAVITTDIARAGGVEQLQAFLNILGLPLHQAEDAKSLKSALAGIKNTPHIIIDTGGLNPFDPQEMKSLARLLAVEEMEPALVLPAGIDAEESAEIAMTFEVLGVRKMIPTRLDFARRLGGLLNAADKTGLSFTEGSHTPQVARGIIRLNAEKMAQLLMPPSSKPGKVGKGKP